MSRSKAQRANIVGDKEQILELLEEMQRIPKYVTARLLEQARINERITNGVAAINRTGNQYMVGRLPADDDGISAPQNIQSQLVKTFASLITKDRPSVYAVPTEKSLQAQSAAEVATKVIEYTEQEEEVQRKWHDIAVMASNHGTGLMKIYFDPTSQRTRWQPVSVFDVILEDRPNNADVEWCAIREFINQWDAEALLSEGEDEECEPAETEYEDGLGIKHKGVEKWEIWYKPCTRYPTGLFACVIGGKVVESMEYPYIFPDADGGKDVALLPVVWWTVTQVRNSAFGTTWASDVSPLQQSLNNLNAKLLKNAKNSQSYLVMPASQGQANEGLDPVSQIIGMPAAAFTGGAAMPQWINPAPVDQNQINERQFLIQQMYDSAGISPQSTGVATSQSGRALAYQAELDNTKQAATIKSLDDAIRNAWNLDLKQKQKFYTSIQKKLIGGDEIVFTGADIAGVNVALEARSAREGQSSVKRDNIKADVAAGLAPPEDLLAMNPGTDQQVSRQYSNVLIDQFLAGEDLSVTPDSINPQIFAEEIDKRIKKALLSNDLSTANDLTEFKTDFLNKMAVEQQSKGSAMPTPPAQGQPAAVLPESINNQPLPAAISGETP